MLNECEQPGLVQTLLLPEDLTLRHLPALNAAHRRLDFTRRNVSLSPVHECVVRVCCIRSFGHFLTNLEGNILHFNPEAGIFTSVSQSEQDNLLQQAKAQIRMAEEEARQNRLMRDMAQLRLQLEVSQLEGSLQQPKAQSSTSPYLVPDTAALCQHLSEAALQETADPPHLPNLKSDLWSGWRLVGGGGTGFKVPLVHT
ncbi:Protein SMG5 [Oryzias melastigma]|uniref:Protein SMG5 n=1 Tax=Oryzias melastigma TaxID=30732 RepID=A0A834CEQ8_ORYME|nr:Protein SMG5 [Oryzias melastigma]